MTNKLTIQAETAPIIMPGQAPCRFPDSMRKSDQPRQTHSLLSTSEHRRDSAGLTYVYPVLSRRAGGISVGINLNPNNACNWHCIYCQVPNLRRGQAPPIDLARLTEELRTLLDNLINGDFIEQRLPRDTPAAARQIVDIAFSGNGEPTSAAEFPAAVDIVQRLRDEFKLNARLRLITNGSLLDRPAVQAGIARLGEAQGEVWFKLDAGTRQDIALINGVALEPAGILRRLCQCAERCPTWIQSCCFSLDGRAPAPEQIEAWLTLLQQAQEQIQKTCPGRLRGIQLYGLARPSQQEAAPRLGRLPAAWLEALAQQVRARLQGLNVCVNP